MNYKVYYYEDNNVCVITETQEQKPELESLMSNTANLRININEKNVENLFSFFKENTIKQILSDNPKIIEIDYSEIENLDFFKENNFKKLVDMINLSITKCNNTINKYLQLKATKINTEDE